LTFFYSDANVTISILVGLNFGINPCGMHKSKFWVFLLLVSLASCQSSRFMQDDMYFTQIDAIREVREYENSRLQAKINNQQDLLTSDEEEITPNEDYYDYSYTSRLRRFNNDDNTWGYYDPYYTNYYWYNNSNPGYFGNSVYSTYNWWGPNFGGNNYTRYGGFDLNNTGTRGWTNPWRSAHSPYTTPYNRYAFNGWNSGQLNNGNLWNTGLGFTNMYYNSYDNNCYSSYYKSTHHLPALMQKNGIQRNVFQRPEINYTAIREQKVAVTTVVDSVSSKGNNVENVLYSEDKTDTYTITLDQNQKTSSTNKTATTHKNTPNSTNSTTTKRWDNHNTDLNITPNTIKTENNTSRSGTYSEGSRNNNYIYSGSAIPNKGSSNKGGTQNKGKDPNK
jgi:hypothetical protein